MHVAGGGTWSILGDAVAGGITGGVLFGTGVNWNQTFVYGFDTTVTGVASLGGSYVLQKWLGILVVSGLYVERTCFAGVTDIGAP